VTGPSQQLPRRRRRPQRGPGPLIVLGVVALVPALVLFGMFRWSDSHVDYNEAAPVPDSPVQIPVPPEALSTGLFAMRRMPTIVSRDLNVEAFEDELAPFLTTLNDRSCVAVSVDGVPIGENNPDIAVIPASNQKLVVAAVALEQLGDDFRYTTTAEVAAEPVAGVVAGDLYLVGGGDPLLTSEWYPSSNLELHPVTSPTQLETLADGVVDAGIQTVDGGVVGDGSRYDDELFAPGWGVGVAGLEAGPYDALMVNDSRVLNETLKANDPVEGAAREFTRLLQDRGVQIGGAPSAGTAPAESIEIASVQSAQMSEVVAEMLGNSDNNTAELLVKELGFNASGIGTREAGLAAMQDQLADWGLSSSAVVLADGSGLSLDNRLTCATLLSVLQRSGADVSIGTALPIAGETGTLADVFVDHAISGRLVGKTGTLNNPPFNVDPPAVKALAGYVVIEGGGAVEYVLILNGPTISDQSEYRPIWNAFVDVLATYPSGPTPADLGPR
jgi:D-alanyl-D-alanine carboxypeptidase/D-alanyl-D-alanine-endopeptidase (penicillin-binding protein 4)